MSWKDHKVHRIVGGLKDEEEDEEVDGNVKRNITNSRLKIRNHEVKDYISNSVEPSPAAQSIKNVTQMPDINDLILLSNVAAASTTPSPISPVRPCPILPLMDTSNNSLIKKQEHHQDSSQQMSSLSILNVALPTQPIFPPPPQKDPPFMASIFPPLASHLMSTCDITTSPQNATDQPIDLSKSNNKYDSGTDGLQQTLDSCKTVSVCQMKPSITEECPESSKLLLDNQNFLDVDPTLLIASLNTPNSSVISSHQDIEFDVNDHVLCRVCGDKASGFHYGVHSCEGCKGFFRRSIQQKIQYRPCNKNEQCNILRINRNRCQYCRLKKCIQAGMSREAVRFGRVPKREKAKMLAAMQSSRLKTQESKLIAELIDESSVVEAVVKAHYDTCDYIRNKVEPFLEKSKVGASYVTCSAEICPMKGGVRTSNQETSSIFSEFESEKFMEHVRKVCTFAKLIPGFKCLNHDDQVTLLKSCVFEVLLVRLTALFDSESMVCLNGDVILRDSIDGVSNLNVKHLMSAVYNFAMRFNRLKLSDAEIGLYSAIVIINGDRDGLQNPELVTRIQSRLKTILESILLTRNMYTVSSTSDDEHNNTSSSPSSTDIKQNGRLVTQHLYTMLEDLKTLNTLHTEKFLQCTKPQTTPQTVPTHLPLSESEKCRRVVQQRQQIMEDAHRNATLISNLTNHLVNVSNHVSQTARPTLSTTVQQPQNTAVVDPESAGEASPPESSSSGGESSASPISNQDFTGINHHPSSGNLKLLLDTRHRTPSIGSSISCSSNESSASGGHNLPSILSDSIAASNSIKSSIHPPCSSSSSTSSSIYGRGGSSLSAATTSGGGCGSSTVIESGQSKTMTKRADIAHNLEQLKVDGSVLVNALTAAVKVSQQQAIPPNHSNATSASFSNVTSTTSSRFTTTNAASNNFTSDLSKFLMMDAIPTSSSAAASSSCSNSTSHPLLKRALEQPSYSISSGSGILESALTTNRDTKTLLNSLKKIRKSSHDDMNEDDRPTSTTPGSPMSSSSSSLLQTSNGGVGLSSLLTSPPLLFHSTPALTKLHMERNEIIANLIFNNNPNKDNLKNVDEQKTIAATISSTEGVSDEKNGLSVNLLPLNLSKNCAGGFESSKFSSSATSPLDCDENNSGSEEKMNNSYSLIIDSSSNESTKDDEDTTTTTSRRAEKGDDTHVSTTTTDPTCLKVEINETSSTNVDGPSD